MSDKANRASDILAAEILAYLGANPHAVDSLQGIVSWWVSTPNADPSAVQQALDELGDRGLVARVTIGDGRTLYAKAPHTMAQ